MLDRSDSRLTQKDRNGTIVGRIGLFVCLSKIKDYIAYYVADAPQVPRTGTSFRIYDRDSPVSFLPTSLTTSQRTVFGEHWNGPFFVPFWSNSTAAVSELEATNFLGSFPNARGTGISPRYSTPCYSLCVSLVSDLEDDVQTVHLCGRGCRA